MPEYVSLVEALPYAMAQTLPVLVWMTTLALAVWGLVRLRRPSSIILAAAIVATLVLLVYEESAIGWVASLVLALSGFALFRRPRATMTIVCVAAWTIAAWTNWGWATVYEETGACIFPGALVLDTDGLFEDEVRCDQPTWT
jgi:hypothetical protein